MPRNVSPNIKAAEDILRGQEGRPKNLLDLAKRLKGENAFKYARRILARACKMPIGERELRLELAQQHALCTYKDPDLPTGGRLERALEILNDGVLNEGETLRYTKNQETLGLAGAIYKRKWELDGQKQHLERAKAYYIRGYQCLEEGDTSDYGYTSINAAFVLDLLADLEGNEAKKAGTPSENAKQQLKDATRIRETLVSTLPDLAKKPGKEWLEKEWWFLVTLAEAHFGLKNYEDAALWLVKATKLKDKLAQEKEEAFKKAAQDENALEKAYNLPYVPEWEYASTARQLAQLAYLHESKSARELKDSEVWKVLEAFLESNMDAVQTVYSGKVGLALSGGGFRASLFHIGVLARLAELDMLRHIEVLSCVSGGSIIGAHYYLEVRKLLQTKKDSEIESKDYIKIIQDIACDFLAGVQRNLRTRVVAEFFTNLKMIFLPQYSRTMRIGELYEKEIFSKIQDGKGKEHRWLNELFVNPLGDDGKSIEAFSPKSDNWRRRNKVPILILNATTLNTGHNWQFTASWMGESPSSIDTEIDGNYRLRRMYYYEAPKRYQRIRLGHAVAASSCVPGLFEPLAFKGFYENKTVRLVDGGVHDNQGTVGLMEQDCQVLIVSDASGQMGTQDNPSRGIIGVPLRSNSILMARVREAEYKDIEARLRSSLLKGRMYVHLKKDLDVNPVDWVNTENPYDASDEFPSSARCGPLTRYGIRKEVQQRLADIRTDLDSFTQAEAYSLMTSGYRMTKYEFANTIKGFPTSSNTKEEWPFLAVEELMKRSAGSKKLLRLLKVASNRAFKIWKLSKPLSIAAIILAIAAVVGFFWASWRWPTFSIFNLSLGWCGAATALVLAGLIFGKIVMRIVRYRETLNRIAIGIVLALFGWLIARLHIHVFDKWYLRFGKIDRIIKSQ